MSKELSKGRSGSTARRTARVLVVTSSAKAADFVGALRQSGHDVVHTDSSATGCAALADQRPDLVLVDQEHAEEVRGVAADLDVPCTLMGDHASMDGDGSLVQFPQQTAPETISVVVELLLEREQMRRDTRTLQAIVDGVRDGSALVGRSPLMRRLQSTLSRAADGDTTVLIEGAPGTGKSMAARVVHCKSRRGNRPLVVHQASTLDAESLQRAFAEAQSSSLLVEDVEQLPTAAQQVLVKFLKERTTRPSGDNAPARVLATSSAHLPELVARGAFREDLYYRLHSYPIVMPSLRERTEDVLLLAESLIDQITASTGQRPAGFTPAARSALESMPWPGNVAQLENVVRRAFLAAGGGPIDERHLSTASMPIATVAATATAVAPATTRSQETEDEVDEQSIRPFEEEEQRLLSRALRATRGNVRRAAQLLGIGRATLYRKIQQFKLRLQ